MPLNSRGQRVKKNKKTQDKKKKPISKPKMPSRKKSY